MVKNRVKRWDKFFFGVALLVFLVEFGIGEMENFYLEFNVYDKSDLIPFPGYNNTMSEE